MSVELAVAPIAWSNSDLPELGGDTTWKPALKKAVRQDSPEPKPVSNTRWTQKHWALCSKHIN